MTIRGKIRIYELSRDLNLDNKDLLDAANKLSISVKSHSSSISDEDAKRIKSFLVKKSSNSSNRAKSKSNKEILSLKKASNKSKLDNQSPKNNSSVEQKSSKTNLSSPRKPARSITGKKDGTLETKNKSDFNKDLNIPKGNFSKHSDKQSNTKITQKPLAPKPRELSKQEIKKPLIINKDSSPQARLSNKNPKSSPQKKSEPLIKLNKPLITKPTLINPPQPKPPSLPVLKDKNLKAKPRGVENRSEFDKPKSNHNKSLGKQDRREPNRANRPTYKSQPQEQKKNNPPELVGAPIRRERPNNKTQKPIQRQGSQPPLRPSPPSRQNNQNKQTSQSRYGNSPPRGNSNRPGSTTKNTNSQGRFNNQQRQEGGQRPGAPRQGRGPQGRSSNQSGRPGIPSGMRKPVAPGELMQLQKPTGRPGSPSPKRSETNAPNRPRRDNSDTTKNQNNRPNPPTAPKRPFHKPGNTGAPRRSKPDWDDSAKLEALRNKANQKQRQKVHIIGENDDALTAETSGFAGEQQATLSTASLARPAKPKGTKKSANKSNSGVRKKKKETTRQRQRRRAMELRASREAKQVRPEMIVVPEENLTVQELADKLSVESSEIIKSLFFKGITATVTQSLDLSTIETVAEEMGVPVLQDDVEEAAKKTVEMIEDADLEHLIRRPPVVTVMGHVDHGKTSLLDAIRKARVASGEAGGITQHIGAYQVTVESDNKKRKLTFLDTPGHEAFTAMRARGTKVTDVAVLVVAADDGVRPQTLEAISHARAAKVPVVVAINKIDKEGASPDRVKQELSEQELIAEEWGGDVVMVPVSAIKGENINKLLDMILLVSEVEDLQANPDRLAKGTVIEAHLDKAKGPVATLLVQNGTLNAGDVIAAGPVLGKIRAMVDEDGSRLKEAGPSCPVEALGFSEVPTAGDEFEVYLDEKSARAVVGDRASDARATRLAQQMSTRRVSLSGMSSQASEGDLKELNVILKADVQGSIEAILGSLEQLPKDEVQVRVLLSAPGEITETDIDLAAASGAVVVGFNTSMASGAKRAADAAGVDVRDYEVIYKLLEDIQLAMEGLLEPEMVEEGLGEAEVRAIFTIGRSAVAGCYVTNGKLQRNCKIKVHRGSQVVYAGDLDSLKRNRDDAKEVATGFECGVGTDRFSNWKEGDKIEAFKMVTQKRKLQTSQS